jgi:hypothetical protein
MLIITIHKIFDFINILIFVIVQYYYLCDNNCNGNWTCFIVLFGIFGVIDDSLCVSGVLPEVCLVVCHVICL